MKQYNSVKPSAGHNTDLREISSISFTTLPVSDEGGRDRTRKSETKQLPWYVAGKLVRFSVPSVSDAWTSVCDSVCVVSGGACLSVLVLAVWTTARVTHFAAVRGHNQYYSTWLQRNELERYRNPLESLWPWARHFTGGFFYFINYF